MNVLNPDNKPASLRVDVDGKLIVSGTGGGGGAGDASAANQVTQSALLTSIAGYVDGLETAVAASNTKLDTLHADLATIDGHVDGVETLLGTSNTNTGGTATSLAIMDDWDETDRCKTNPIVGQAGVAGGAGAISAATIRTVPASDSVQSVISPFLNPSATVTRPADTTAYAVGDAVSNSTTAGSVTPMTFTVARVNAGPVMIRRCRFTAGDTGLAGVAFRLHLYLDGPSTKPADNAAYSTSNAAAYLGALDIAAVRGFVDGVAGFGIPEIGSEINFLCGSGLTSIIGYLETRTAHTPGASAVYMVSLEAYPG